MSVRRPALVLAVVAALVLAVVAGRSPGAWRQEGPARPPASLSASDPQAMPTLHGARWTNSPPSPEGGPLPDAPAEREVVVRARLVSEEGTPLSGVELRLEQFGSEDKVVLDGVLEGRLDRRPTELAGWRSWIRSGSDGSFELAGHPGTAFLVTGPMPEGTLPVEQLVRLPQDPTETQVDVVVRGVRSFGALRVRWLDARGQVTSDAEATLQTAWGTDVQELVPSRRDPLGPIDAPAGTFLLRVRSATRRSEFLFGEPAADDWRLEEVVPVSIEAGRAQTVDVEIREGGRLRVHAEIPRDGWPRASDKSSGIEPDPLLARALRIDGSDVVPIFFAHFDSPGHDQAHRTTARLEHWTRATYTRLAPGQWRVQAKRQGVAWAAANVVEADVEVRAREVADVRLVLPE